MRISLGVSFSKESIMKTQWPELVFSEWKDTLETLHRFLQVAGKLRMCKSPWANHSWNSALYVTSRGLTTSAIPLGERSLTVDFDFLDHQVKFEDSQGLSFVIPLVEQSVASFYDQFQDALKIFEVKPTFSPIPNEVMDATPLYSDEIHHSYNAVKVHDFFHVLVRVSNVLSDYRSEFVGKSSPVHFFWGAMDLAVTRFSGKTAPEHPGGMPHVSDDIIKEAYSHEVMSCGFWPGNEMYPKAAFYAYAYPVPEKLKEKKLSVADAYFNEELGEFILDYDSVKKSADPAGAVKEFFESSYSAIADLLEWDRNALEVSSYLSHMKEKGLSLNS